MDISVPIGSPHHLSHSLTHPLSHTLSHTLSPFSLPFLSPLYRVCKGLRFTDSVAWATRDCDASRADPDAVLLLCEVAMGNMYVLNRVWEYERVWIELEYTHLNGLVY